MLHRLSSRSSTVHFFSKKNSGDRTRADAFFLAASARIKSPGPIRRGPSASNDVFCACENFFASKVGGCKSGKRDLGGEGGLRSVEESEVTSVAIQDATPVVSNRGKSNSEVALGRS